MIWEDFLFFAILYTLFFGIPIFSVVFFITCLILFIRAKVKAKRDPESIAPKVLKRRTVMLIVSAITGAILLTISIGTMLLFVSAFAYM